MQVLPGSILVGYTGSTGMLKEQHIVHSWEFSSTLAPEEAGETTTPEKKKAGKIIWMVSLVVAVGVLLGGVSIAWGMVVKRKRRQPRQERDHEWCLPKRGRAYAVLIRRVSFGY